MVLIHLELLPTYPGGFRQFGSVKKLEETGRVGVETIRHS